MKLTTKDKLKIIMLYEKGYSVSKIMSKFKVAHTTVERIERQYREHGIESFKKKKMRHYSAEFKYTAIKRVQGGESILSVASSLLINEAILCNWIKKYNELGYNGLEGKKSKKRPPNMINEKEKESNKQNDSLEINERLQLEQLKQENQQLKMEVDLLKKLNALVQQRKQQQKKKK